MRVRPNEGIEALLPETAGPLGDGGAVEPFGGTEVALERGPCVPEPAVIVPGRPLVTLRMGEDRLVAVGKKAADLVLRMDAPIFDGSDMGSSTRMWFPSQGRSQPLSRTSVHVSGMSRYSREGTSANSIPALSSASCRHSQAGMTVSGVLRYRKELCEVQTALLKPYDASFPARNRDSSIDCAPSSSPGRMWQWQS